MYRSLFMAAVVATAAFGASSNAIAYPDKPITVIVPFSAGGSTTTAMRTVAYYLSPELGVNVVIKNIAGAGGSVGLIEAINSKPDGYTVGIYATNIPVAQALGQPRPELKDYKPACMVAEFILGVAVKGDSKIKTLEDYHALARSKPGEVGIAMGLGTLAQFASKAYSTAIGAELKLVNAGSGAKKMAAVMGGHVEALITPVAGMTSAHRAGQLKVIGVMHSKRLDVLPDVPTMKEAGVNIVHANSLVMVMPNGTPDEHIKVLCDGVERVGKNKEFQAKVKEMGLTWAYGDAAVARKYITDKKVEMEAIAASLKN